MVNQEKLKDYIAELLMEYGPDGHTDGAQEIAIMLQKKYIVLDREEIITAH